MYLHSLIKSFDIALLRFETLNIELIVFAHIITLNNFWMILTYIHQ
jgi:hypothetical protein